MKEITEVNYICQFVDFVFNVWNATIFPICKKRLTESHSACIAGSKQHIGNPISEANACIEIFRHRYQF